MAQTYYTIICTRVAIYITFVKTCYNLLIQDIVILEFFPTVLVDRV